MLCLTCRVCPSVSVGLLGAHYINVRREETKHTTDSSPSSRQPATCKNHHPRQTHTARNKTGDTKKKHRPETLRTSEATAKARRRQQNTPRAKGLTRNSLRVTFSSWHAMVMDLPPWGTAVQGWVSYVCPEGDLQSGNLPLAGARTIRKGR